MPVVLHMVRAVECAIMAMSGCDQQAPILGRWEADIVVIGRALNSARTGAEPQAPPIRTRSHAAAAVATSSHMTSDFRREVNATAEIR